MEALKERIAELQKRLDDNLQPHEAQAAQMNCVAWVAILECEHFEIMPDMLQDIADEITELENLCFVESLSF